MQYLLGRQVRHGWRVLSVMLLTCVVGFAQQTGTLSGTVLDQTGKAIPNASVTN